MAHGQNGPLGVHVHERVVVGYEPKPDSVNLGQSTYINRNYQYV